MTLNRVRRVLQRSMKIFRLGDVMQFILVELAFLKFYIESLFLEIGDNSLKTKPEYHLMISLVIPKIRLR